MSEGAPLEWVIFDLGGVMVRLAGSWSKACELAGVAPPASIDDPALMAELLPLVDQSERGQLDQAGFCRGVADAAGMRVEDVHDVTTAWLVEPYPGLDGLIDRLHAAGLKTACLSNTNAHHWSIMTGEGNAASLPLGRLHRRFASHVVGARKPEASIYAHVEAELGAAPGALMFFDDNLPNVEAALARGWRSVRVDPHADPAAQVREAVQAALGPLG
ncbi:MAG: HAD-IA family hydrolase [Planctomycetota bacterium]